MGVVYVPRALREKLEPMGIVPSKFVCMFVLIVGTLSINQDTACCPNHIEKCTKLPLKQF